MGNPVDIEITGALAFSTTEAKIKAVSPKGRDFLAHHGGGVGVTEVSVTKSALGAWLECAAAEGVREFLS